MWCKIVILIISSHFAQSEPNSDKRTVSVNKCCDKNELVVDDSCQHVNHTNTTVWTPLFTDEKGNTNIPVDFKLIIGEPDCGSTQQWPVLHYSNSLDKLILLPNGILRHYAYQKHPENNDYDEEERLSENSRHHDYEPGKYCLDKSLSTNMKLMSQYALVCAPEAITNWQDAEFVMTKIIDPIFHATSMICFLIVAIVYFIMPTLRDLVGNIITTISICMIVSQAADMVRIFTEFSSHVSFIIAEIVSYTSLLGAFFWLNSLGYYVWRTFKSRNVFLRVTDGRKYCYYSSYAWSCTIVMGLIAVAAHFTLEMPRTKSSSLLSHDQEVIGSLGMAVFFTPVAFTILVNIFFYSSTVRIISHRDTYGRIHHKLKHSFRMFLLIFMIMSLTWLFMLLSWLKYNALIYIYIMINALQAPLFLYICVFDQKHVSFLLRKSCCYANCIFPCCRPEPECDWGDEMTAMNSGIY